LRVRGRIFVTVPPGDPVIHLFVPEAVRETALALHPAFLEKLFWGGKLWGLRATLSTTDTAVIRRLIEQAWASKAPETLLEAAGGRRRWVPGNRALPWFAQGLSGVFSPSPP
jgi:hypothetical protein